MELGFCRIRISHNIFTNAVNSLPPMALHFEFIFLVQISSREAMTTSHSLFCKPISLWAKHLISDAYADQGRINHVADAAYAAGLALMGASRL